MNYPFLVGVLAAAGTVVASSTYAQTGRGSPCRTSRSWCPPPQQVPTISPAASSSASLQEGKLVPVTVTVSNKPGGGHSIGLAYLNQRAGDGHFLMVETGTMLVNEITGKLNVRHADITPIASTGISSPLRSVRIRLSRAPKISSNA